jgi:uncharacterized protein (TIRG00374 family)
MTPGVRRLLLNALRYGICAAALWIVVRALSWEQIKVVTREAEWRWALAALLALAPVPFVLALRLTWLLRANDVRITYGQSLAVTFAGMFANFVLPGQTSGDVLKAVYVARFTDRRHEAATVVFFDRILGLMCVVLLSGFMLLLNWRDPAVKRWGQFIGVAFVAMLVPAVLYFSDWFRRLIRWERVLERLPLREHIRRIDQAVLVYRRHRLTVVRAMLLTWMLQIIAIFATFLAGRALGVVGPSLLNSLQIYLVYIPICWMAGALPISPQGLGVLELAYKTLLHDAAGFGTAEGATLLSMLTRFLNLAWSLPGLLFHLTLSKPRPAVAVPDTKEKISTA